MTHISAHLGTGKMQNAENQQQVRKMCCITFHSLPIPNWQVGNNRMQKLAQAPSAWAKLEEEVGWCMYGVQFALKLRFHYSGGRRSHSSSRGGMGLQRLVQALEQRSSRRRNCRAAFCPAPRVNSDMGNIPYYFYYDYMWSICSKPVASRIFDFLCMMKHLKEKEILFTMT